MIPALVVFSLFAGVILVVATHAAELMLRTLRLPRRGVWLAALALLVTLTFAAPFRASSVAPLTLPASVAPLVEDATVRAPGDVRPSTLRHAFERFVNAPLHLVTALLDSRSAGDERAGQAASRLATVLAAMWVMSSGLLLAGLGWAMVRVRMLQRTSSVRIVAGARVRISATSGPAVVGALRPQIVLPAWLLDRPEAEQRLIVDHERGHVAARDPLLLLFGYLTLVLLPWNVCAWWMMRRMRLALEIDCDARVLRGRPNAHTYATLLLATAERRSTLRVLSAALADSRSDLERRLHAMNESTTSHPVIRAAGGAVVAIALVLAACEADLPTAAELDAMNAGELVDAAAPIASLEDARYMVDGVEVDADAANAIAPERIASINVRKGADVMGEFNVQSVIEITTRERRGDLEAIGLEPMPGRGFDGLLLIDGERVETDALRELDPATIASIEVVKGAAAAQIYSEPEARNGVINIRLKGATP